MNNPKLSGSSVIVNCCRSVEIGHCLYSDTWQRVGKTCHGGQTWNAAVAGLAILNPRSEISDWAGRLRLYQSNFISRISDLEMQDSSNFKIFLIPFQFIRQGRGVVHLSKCFDNRGAMHGNGSVRLLQVNEISRETFDVAVEYKTDEFAIPIDDRRSGIASNDVSRHHEIERGGEFDSVARSHKSESQLKRRVVIKTARVIIQAIERRS